MSEHGEQHPASKEPEVRIDLTNAEVPEGLDDEVNGHMDNLRSNGFSMDRLGANQMHMWLQNREVLPSQELIIWTGVVKNYEDILTEDAKEFLDDLMRILKEGKGS